MLYVYIILCRLEIILSHLVIKIGLFFNKFKVIKPFIWKFLLKYVKKYDQKVKKFKRKNPRVRVVDF